MRGFRRATCIIPAVAGACLVAACGYGPIHTATDSPVPPDYASLTPVPPASSYVYPLQTDDQLVGELQVTLTSYEDTLPGIARRFNLGYEEIQTANPVVDPWLPGERTPVLLPTRFVLPDAPRKGIVLNVASLRLFYYPDSGDDGPATVISHPIGIGRVDWQTPLGETTVVSKARDPVWYVPRSIREEHAAAGDPLPSVVPPGPDNPLGEFVLQLGMPGYLIHDTNKPVGVGMRVSHGCVRLYPEDIRPLYASVSLGTPVTIVNQPYLAGWSGDTLYLEAHRPLEEDDRDPKTVLIAVVSDAIDVAGYPEAKIDWGRVRAVADSALGIPVPITKRSPRTETIIAQALFVENTLPAGTNLEFDPAYDEPDDSQLAQSGDE